MMNKELEMARIRYQIERYRAMGNGSMCQELYAQLRKLETQGSIK